MQQAREISKMSGEHAYTRIKLFLTKRLAKRPLLFKKPHFASAEPWRFPSLEIVAIRLIKALLSKPSEGQLAPFVVRFITLGP
jgi:hypothetical protein